MNEREIRKLIQLVEESEIGELEVRSWWLGRRVRISKQVPAQNNTPAAGPVQMVPAPNPGVVPATAAERTPAAPTTEPPAEEVAAPETWSEDRYHIIRSPIVGTFYRAPAPDAPPYVQEGEKIKAGQVVCIVEAMKLMNEIQAEMGGTVVKLLVENAEPVEYNQMMIVIDPEA
jgi:acetyl-CoA carboxylase biotin carboxyl carrier protein